MSQDIHRWTKEYQKCSEENSGRISVPPSKLIVTVRPYGIFGVDINELGQTANGNRYAVTVNHFSEYAAAYPVPGQERRISSREHILQIDSG